MAAPALAAAIQEPAISLGVIGTLLERSVLSPAPVTAQVIKISFEGCRPVIIASPLGCSYCII